MLYQIYETNRAWISPFSEFASAASKLYSNPLSALAQIPSAHRVSAGFDLMHRLTKEYEKPEFGIRHVDIEGQHVAIDERIEIDAQSRCVELPFRYVELHHVIRAEGAHLGRSVTLNGRRNRNGCRTGALQEAAAGHGFSVHRTSPERRNQTVRMAYSGSAKLKSALPAAMVMNWRPSLRYEIGFA